jgi:hypothetical protein
MLTTVCICSFYRCEFDPVKGGTMHELKYCRNFMDTTTE